MNNNADFEPQLSPKEKLILKLVVASPLLIYAGISGLGSYYNHHPDPQPIVPYESYNLRVNIEDNANNLPRINHGQKLIQEYNPGGIVLEIKGMKIETGLSSEELLDQISVDYQDLFDYYGGAEELY